MASEPRTSPVPRAEQRLKQEPTQLQSEGTVRALDDGGTLSPVGAGDGKEPCAETSQSVTIVTYLLSCLGEDRVGTLTEAMRRGATSAARLSGVARDARPRFLCTTAAVPKPPDTRPWFIRNWGTSLFLSAGGTWGYTLWVANKARKASDAAEEAVKARMPANSDELLELRALNDVPAASLGTLPERAAAAGRSSGANGREMLALLRAVVAPPTAPPAAPPPPLKEEYVIERMLMALPGAVEGGARTDVRLATSVLSFLSAGTVRERLETMYHSLAVSDADEGSASTAGVPSSLLVQLLDALMVTGQVPPEKVVCVEDEGRDALGIQRSWYRVPPVREYTADEWAAALLQEHPPSSAVAGADDAGVAAAEARIDFERFVAMMESQRVCLWGECYQINERRRLAKLKDDAEEALRDPPFYRRMWNMVTGGG